MKGYLWILLLVMTIASVSVLLAQTYTATITTDKDVLTVGETVTITVTISPPTAGVTITIKIIDPIGAERTLPPETTDANGKAVFYWTPEIGIRPGTYTLEAYISGQPGVAATKTIRIVVPPPVGGSVIPTNKLELVQSYVETCIKSILSEVIVTIVSLSAAIVVLYIVFAKRKNK